MFGHRWPRHLLSIFFLSENDKLAIWRLIYQSEADKIANQAAPFIINQNLGELNAREHQYGFFRNLYKILILQCKSWDCGKVYKLIRQVAYLYMYIGTKQAF